MFQAAGHFSLCIKLFPSKCYYFKNNFLQSGSCYSGTECCKLLQLVTAYYNLLQVLVSELNKSLFKARCNSASYERTFNASR